MWREDREREAKIEDLRREQSRLECDSAYARGLKFGDDVPLRLLPSFVTGRIGTRPKPQSIGIMDRGVYRDPFSPEGWADFTIIDSRGLLRRKIGMPADDVDENTVRQMNRWLDRVDPLLKVMA